LAQALGVVVGISHGHGIDDLSNQEHRGRSAVARELI
jgi:hypothetical protein